MQFYFVQAPMSFGLLVKIGLNSSADINFIPASWAILQLISRHALLVMSSGFNSKNLHYSLCDLMRLLNMEDDAETVAMCEAHGLTVGEKGVHFVKGNFKEPEEVRCDVVTWSIVQNYI